LDREKQVNVVAELTRIVAAAAGDPAVKERIWCCSPKLPRAAGDLAAGRTPMQSSSPWRASTRQALMRQSPGFDVAWRTIDGLNVRYAREGEWREGVLFSPWPESIFAFAPVWDGLTKQFEVLRSTFPVRRSEARDDLFAPRKMGEFIVKAIEAFGLTSVHAVGLDVGSPSVLFAALVRPELFRSLIVGAGATVYHLSLTASSSR